MACIGVKAINSLKSHMSPTGCGGNLTDFLVQVTNYDYPALHTCALTVNQPQAAAGTRRTSWRRSPAMTTRRPSARPAAAGSPASAAPIKSRYPQRRFALEEMGCSSCTWHVRRSQLVKRPRSIYAADMRGKHDPARMLELTACRCGNAEHIVKYQYEASGGTHRPFAASSQPTQALTCHHSRCNPQRQPMAG